MDDMAPAASFGGADNASFAWPTAGQSGKVPTESVVRDKGQPRQYFDPEEQKNLKEGVEKDGQREVITVRELTPEERSSGEFPPEARYELVSGERRWRAVQEAGLHFIEVRVKAYAMKRDQMLDAWHLNENRVGVSAYENAMYLKKLIAEFEWKTPADIMRALGKSRTWVEDHLAVIDAPVEIQDRMRPEIPEGDRIKTPFVKFLSNFETPLQIELFNSIPKKYKTATAQTNWVKAELRQRGISTIVRRNKPSRVRERLENLARTIAEAVETYDSASLQVLTDTSTGALVVTIANLHRSHDKLGELIKRIEQLPRKDSETGKTEAPVKTSPKVVRPTEVVTRLQGRTPPPTITPRVYRKEERPPPSASPAKETPASPPEPTQHRRAVAPRQIPKKGTTVFEAPPPPPPQAESITVSYWDQSVVRCVLNAVTPRKYIELWDKKLLQFQREGLPKPDHYLTREEAERKANGE